MRTFWKNWGLTLALAGLFLGAWLGQSLTGWKVYNTDQMEHAERPVTYGTYLTTSHFWEATGENWESEFLQMFTFVVLTIFLRQVGSPESDPPDEPAGAERAPKQRAPVWPVRRGGAWLKFYENSLSIALILLFLVSFGVHAAAGARNYSAEQEAHGEPAVTTIQYLGSAQMWQESFQNWQSEWMSTAVLIVLTVYLRQKGSSQSKPVEEATYSQGE